MPWRLERFGVSRQTSFGRTTLGTRQRYALGSPGDGAAPLPRSRLLRSRRRPPARLDRRQASRLGRGDERRGVSDDRGSVRACHLLRRAPGVGGRGGAGHDPVALGDDALAAALRGGVQLRAPLRGRRHRGRDGRCLARQHLGLDCQLRGEH